MNGGSSVEPLSLTVDRAGIRPVDCSQSLAQLLGYESRRQCLKAIGRRSPALGLNLQQLGSIADRPQASIPLLDRHCRRVGEITRVRPVRQGRQFLVDMVADGTDGTSQRVLASSPMTVDLAGGGVFFDAGSAQAGQLLGCDGSLADFLALVVDQDRDRLAAMLVDDACRDWRLVYFRLSDLSGRLLEARYHFRASAGTLVGQLQLMPLLAGYHTTLTTLASVPGVVIDTDREKHIDGDTVLLLPRGFNAHQFLADMVAAIASSWYDARMVVSASTSGGRCCCCAEQLSGQCIVVEIIGAGADTGSLHQMVSDKPPEPGPCDLHLTRLIHRIHDQGMHTAISLTVPGDIRLRLAPAGNTTDA